MTRGHPELVATARLVEDYAVAYESAQRVLDEEWAALDWHPPGEGEHVTSTPVSPVEAALDRKLSLEADRAQLDDDRRTLAAITHSALTVARAIAKRAPPTPHTVPRCDGKIDPSCTNAASDHRDPETRSPISGLCDACWLKACPGCYLRAADPRRNITVAWGVTHGCEACYRTELRRAQRASTGRTADW